MILLKKTQVSGWEAAIRGMRNPMNSWEKSDSLFLDPDGDYFDINGNTGPHYGDVGEFNEGVFVGTNDHDLMMRLAKGGSVHAKYRRMITVTVDITAPLYWWKEFDTYKVGTVANSCSTMHKIHAKEFTLDDFSHEHLDIYAIKALENVVDVLNRYRSLYINYNADDFEVKGVPSQKLIWWQMIQLLPSSYNQKRTVLMNYEVLTGIYPMRKNHKLDEWHEFCHWIEGLPYSEVIIGEKKKPLTYGDLYEKFKKQNPLLGISDVRPYCVPGALIIWASDFAGEQFPKVKELAFQYDEEKDIFLPIKGAKSYYEILTGLH